MILHSQTIVRDGRDELDGSQLSTLALSSIVETHTDVPPRSENQRRMMRREVNRQEKEQWLNETTI